MSYSTDVEMILLTAPEVLTSAAAAWPWFDPQIWELVGESCWFINSLEAYRRPLLHYRMSQEILPVCDALLREWLYATARNYHAAIPPRDAAWATWFAWAKTVIPSTADNLDVRRVVTILQNEERPQMSFIMWAAGGRGTYADYIATNVQFYAEFFNRLGHDIND